MLVQIQSRALAGAGSGFACQTERRDVMGMEKDVTDKRQPFSDDLAQAVRMEGGLADMVQATKREVQHTECLDGEQRAEVYTILDALKNDTDAHREVVGRWISDRAGGG